MTSPTDYDYLATPPDQYSVEVGEARPGETRPRRHYLLGDKPLVNGAEFFNSQNLWEGFLGGEKASNGGTCLGVRAKNADGTAGDFVWQSYAQIRARALNVGHALTHLGLTTQGFVGLYSVNRLEWTLGELGSYTKNLCTVPLYDTLGDESIVFIINQTEMTLVFATCDKAANLLRLKERIPTLKTIILMDAPPTGDTPYYPDEAARAACVFAPADLATKARTDLTEAGFEVYAHLDLEKLGSENPSDLVAATPDDLATICYTSGTTGLPKGVMLTHNNILSDGAGFMYLGDRGESIIINSSSYYLSFLPLAHVFERVVFQVLLLRGATIGFYQGDIRTLMDDIAALRPTIFVAVPRLLNRVYDRIRATIDASPFLSKFLFDTAYNTKLANVASGSRTHWLWDRLVFSKVRERLGGRVQYILSGSAPVSAEILQFLRVCFSCYVFEGYGQTETTAGATLTCKSDFSSGHTGPPMPNIEVKLVDVPEMNYFSTDKPFPRGEVCLRGYSITHGYYKDEEKTRADIIDGYIYSGDIGLWDERGRLRIIDRKKNIFKLAQGEYIAPEKIEIVYGKAKYVAQVFVHGDSLKAFLVGIVIPDEETLMPWAKEQPHLAGKSFEEVCNDPAAVDLVLKDMVKTGKELDLKGFEQVKKIHLTPVQFSVENDCMTPTFKLKRPQCKSFHQEVIDKMIAEVEAAEQAK